jgi:hypothetical protein
MISGMFSRCAAALVCFVSLSAANLASAATLSPQAVFCESAEALDLLERDNLKDQPGPVVMTRVKASLEFYALTAKINTIRPHMVDDKKRTS